MIFVPDGLRPLAKLGKTDRWGSLQLGDKAETVRVTKIDALPAVPWKNGGGVTRNLAIEPEDAGFDNFIWRVSIADMAESGEFSSFRGVDRVIVLLSGN